MQPTHVFYPVLKNLARTLTKFVADVTADTLSVNRLFDFPVAIQNDFVSTGLTLVTQLF